MKLAGLDLPDLLDSAKRTGCTTSLDTDWDSSGRWARRLAGALEKVDYLLTNEEEGRALTGRTEPSDVARCLLAQGPRGVIIKRGAAGALAATTEGVEQFPACEVRVVDTTCAGDAFAAGFLCALIEGYPLGRAVPLANAAGALATTQLSHWGVDSLATVIELMEKSPRARAP